MSEYQPKHLRQGLSLEEKVIEGVAAMSPWHIGRADNLITCMFCQAFAPERHADDCVYRLANRVITEVYDA
jgi:hypothetical protein